MNWTDLFTEAPGAIQPAPKRVTSLLKSYRYANKNFGSAITAMSLKRYVESRHNGMSDMEASDYVYCCLMDDFVNNANEQRVMEFFDEMPPSWRTELEVLWLKAVQGAASNQERERDEGLI